MYTKCKCGLNIEVILKTAVVILLLLLPAAALAQQKNFKVGKNGHLVVDLSYGDVTINTWDKNEVSVRYDVEDDENEGISVRSSGNYVKVTSDGSYQSDVDVSIPENFFVEIKTDAGNINVNGNLTGSLNVNTSGGEITVRKVSGSIDLLTYGGNIKALDLDGDIKISTYGGDIQISSIDGIGTIYTAGGNISIKKAGKKFTISTGGGNITMDNIFGSNNLKTGGGNVVINNISDNAELNTGGGDIKSNSVAGDISASTGSGNVAFYKINGCVKLNCGSGDVLLQMLNANSDSRIKTSNGNIKLYLPENAKVTVEAKIRDINRHYDDDESSYITCELKPSSKEVNRESNTYKTVYNFNGGGKRIYLETSFGDETGENRKN